MALADPVRGVVHRGDFSLQYSVEGEGRPALVIGSTLYYSRLFAQGLRRHLRLAFVDHRGFAPGNTCTDKAAYSLAHLLDDAEQMRQMLGLGRVVVIGHSGHGILALEYAKRFPESVSHVVMLCTAPNFSAAGHAAAERYLADSVCPERKAYLAEQMAKLPAAIAAAPEKAFVTFCLLTGAKSWFDFRFDAAPFWQDVSVNMTMFDHVWGEIFRDIDITNGLDALAVPVFLGLGRYDFLVPPPHCWEPVRERFRDLTVRVFEKSSHGLPYEEPEAFEAELLAWLAKP